MITAVTLNPCIDRTVFLSGLKVGGHNVAERVQNDVSGKGINVNVVLANLGIATKAVGFEFCSGGTPVENFLSAKGIPFEKFSVEAELRVNTKLHDSESNEMTEINCKGPKLGRETVDSMMEIFNAALEGTDILVIDGSVPPGVDRNIYKTMTELAHSKGIKVVLDATGDLFEHALEAKPDVIKPNIGELELLLGRSIKGREEALKACRELIEKGVGCVCLSLGKDGAMLVNAEGAWYSAGVDIPVRGFQGAGDSVVAGVCIAMLEGASPEEMLRSGVAAAHGSLLRDGTLLCLREDYDRFMKLIPVEKM